MDMSHILEEIDRQLIVIRIQLIAFAVEFASWVWIDYMRDVRSPKRLIVRWDHCLEIGSSQECLVFSLLMKRSS